MCSQSTILLRFAQLSQPGGHGIISGFDKGKCAAPVVVAMTSFGCTAQTKRGQSFHKTGIVTDGMELAFSMLFQSHFCCAIKGNNTTLY